MGWFLKIARAFALLLLWLAVTAGQGHSATLLRIASGGQGGTDQAGFTWLPDKFFNGGAVWVNCGSSTTPACPASLAPPFFNLRYATSFSYTLSVAPGIYNITLDFIEPNKTAAGQRIFNVSLNGQAALNQFDIFQAAGAALSPLSRVFPVVATSGQIQIQFTAVLGNAVISGIAVDPLPQGPPGPFVPIQYDSYVVVCSAQPPQNCSGKFALTREPVGRIGVFLRPPGSPGSLLLTPDQYSVGPPDGAGGISVTIMTPTPDNSTVTLVYPATGPASAIGGPQ